MTTSPKRKTRLMECTINLSNEDSFRPFKFFRTIQIFTASSLTSGLVDLTSSALGVLVAGYLSLMISFKFEYFER